MRGLCDIRGGERPAGRNLRQVQRTEQMERTHRFVGLFHVWSDHVRHQGTLNLKPPRTFRVHSACPTNHGGLGGLLVRRGAQRRGRPVNSTFRVHHGLLAHPIARKKNRWLATLAPLRAPNEGKCSCDPSCWCPNVTYAEYNSSGPGAKPSSRFKLSELLTDAQAARLTPMTVLRGWVPRLHVS